MKDYHCLDGMIANSETMMKMAYDKGYKQVYVEGQKRDLEHTENIVRSHEKCKSVLEAEYKRGVNDLWESVCKFMDADIVSDKEIWGCTSWEKFAQLSPSEVIERLKEYNKNQEPIVRCCKYCKHSENGMVGNGKRCADCHYDRVSKGNTLFEPMESDNSKIEVGDEVKRADIDKSLVIIKFTEEGWALGMNEEGNILDVKLSVYKKTGKHFDQIAEVFNSLKGDIDA